MKITRREARLLGALGAIVLVFLFYQFVYTPQINTITELEAEKDLLDKHAEVVEGNLSKTNPIHNKMKNTNYRIKEKTDKYFDEIIQEDIILILNHLLEELEIKLDNIVFIGIHAGPVLTVEADEMDDEVYLNTLVDNIITGESKPVEKKEITNNSTKGNAEEENPLDIYNMEVQIKIEGHISEILKLVKYIEEYEKNIFIRAVDITGQEKKDAVTCKFTLDFYSIPKLTNTSDEGVDPWDSIVTEGFYPLNMNNKKALDKKKSAYSFFMTLKPYTADLPTLVMGRANDNSRQSYLYADNMGFENVEIVITKKDNKYYCKYKTSKDKYPKSYDESFEFYPIDDQIELKILANPRTNTTDNSGVSLNVNNGTDLRFNIIVENDDIKTSRVKLAGRKGDVVITRKVAD